MKFDVPGGDYVAVDGTAKISLRKIGICPLSFEAIGDIKPPTNDNRRLKSISTVQRTSNRR